MNSYRIKLVSQTNAALLLFTLFGIFFILAATVNLKPLAIPFTVAIFVAAYFIWGKYATGITIWTLNEKGVSIVWEKRFFGAKTIDYFFKWSDIKKIWRGIDPNYYNLKFRLYSGKTITFFHNARNDDFYDLLPVLHSMWDRKKQSN